MESIGTVPLRVLIEAHRELLAVRNDEAVPFATRMRVADVVGSLGYYVKSLADVQVEVREAV